MLGRAKQGASGRAHGRGTAADAGQELLDIRTKRGDGGIDRGASLLLAADGGALLLGLTLLRYVLVCRDPTAAGQRLVPREHDAAIACLYIMRLALALFHRVEDFLHVAVDVAGEQPGLLAILDESFERAAWFHNLGIKFVHLEVAGIEQDNAALRIEYVKNLRLTVKRIRDPEVMIVIE